MGHGHGGCGKPPRDRRALKTALTLAAHDPDSSASIPFRYAIDLLERRYGQRPGSARTWPADDLLRALSYQSIEATVKGKRG